MRSCVTLFCLLSFWPFNPSTFEAPGSGHVFFQFIVEGRRCQTLNTDYDELKGWMLNQPGPSWDILRSANHGNDADPGPDEGVREKPLRGFRQQAERRRDTHEHDAGVSRSRWTRGKTDRRRG